MVRATIGILAEIVEQKRNEVAGMRPHTALLQAQAAARSDYRNFRETLQAHPPAVIAEIKKASPSKGILSEDFDPASIAKVYQEGGAACLSVLTDRQYFQGSLDDLKAARAVVDLPVLRKDFIIDEIQIFEAAAHSADCILLIAAILDVRQLRDFRELAQSLHLSALVEVHNEMELAAAIDSGADLIGVNNRNLDTFEVSLDTSLRLSEKIPSSAVRVSESGIFTRDDVERLRSAGFQAFLVGESLMKAKDPAASLRALVT